jgi:FSR family fosmidomycin resistance protein-like MFS transporter
MTFQEMKRGANGDLALLAAGHLLSDVYASFLVALLPLWVQLFDLPFSAVGFLMFVRSAGITVFEPIGGHIADHTGKRVFPFGLLLAALSMSLVGVAPSYAVLILLIVLASAGQSLFGPQATSMAASSSGSFRGLSLAIFLAGGSLGAALGPIAITSLVSALDIQKTWLMVLPGLLLPILLYRRFVSRAGEPHKAETIHKAVGRIRWRPALALAGVLLLRGAAETGILAFLPILVEQKGGSLVAAGATVSMFKLAGACAAIVVGFLSDRMFWKPFMAVSFVLAFVFLYGFVGTDGYVAFILVALLGATLLSSSSYTVVLAQNLLPGRMSTAAGLVYSFSLLGGGAGALCEGFLADSFGVEKSLLIIGAILPLSAAAATLGIQEKASDFSHGINKVLRR